MKAPALPKKTCPAHHMLYSLHGRFTPIEEVPTRCLTKLLNMDKLTNLENGWFIETNQTTKYILGLDRLT